MWLEMLLHLYQRFKGYILDIGILRYEATGCKHSGDSLVTFRTTTLPRCTFSLETKNRRDKSLLVDVRMFCDLISVRNESCCYKCSCKIFLSNITDKMCYGNNHLIGYDCIWALELKIAFIWSRWYFTKMPHVSITQLYRSRRWLSGKGVQILAADNE